MSSLQHEMDRISEEVILSHKILHQLTRPELNLKDHKPLKEYDTEEMYSLLHKLTKTDLITVTLKFWYNGLRTK